MSLPEQLEKGVFLLAMPDLADPNFARSVVLLCSHDEEGSMGLCVNRPMETDPESLLDDLNLPAGADRARAAKRLSVRRGGPVSPRSGFVLHTSDYSVPDATMPVSEGVTLSMTTDVLQAMVGGEGPRLACLMVGYAGWGAGQLEVEVQRNDWLVLRADPLWVFEAEAERLYDRILRASGIDPAALLSGGTA